MKPMYNKNFIIYKTETENKSLLPSYHDPTNPKKIFKFANPKL